MIKINLLPKGINDKKVISMLMMVFGILFVAVIAGAFAYTTFVINPKINQAEKDLDTAIILQGQAEANLAKIAEVNAGVADIKAKLDFFKAVAKYNTEYPELYKKVAKWTYAKIVLDSLSCDGNTVNMTARAKNLRDLGRYLLNLYRANELYTQVAISGGVPGYPVAAGGASAAQNPMGGPGSVGGFGASISAVENSLSRSPVSEAALVFSVSCQLRKPITAPSFVAGSAAPAASGTGAPGAPLSPAGPSVVTPSGSSANTPAMSMDGPGRAR